MDNKVIGVQIASLRRSKGLTQNELAERLGISYQAVSKWERGETLPDVSILLDLANILETSVDRILSGDRAAMHYRGRITVDQMREGLMSLKRMGEYLGKEHLLYRAAVEGINKSLNTKIEDAFTDDAVFECFLAEAIIQNLINGKYIDATDVKNGFQYDRFRNVVLAHCQRHGIK